MNNSRNRAVVPYVQGYASNDPKSVVIYAKDITNITSRKELGRQETPCPD